MAQKQKTQMVVDISSTEQDLLNTASLLIQKALQLKDSSTTRKLEYLLLNFDTNQIGKLLQATGNVCYIRNYPSMHIEALKSVWKLSFHNKSKEQQSIFSLACGLETSHKKSLKVGETL